MKSLPIKIRYCGLFVFYFSCILCVFAQSSDPQSFNQLSPEQRRAFEIQAQITLEKLEGFINDMIKYKKKSLGKNAQELAIQLFSSEDNNIWVIPNVRKELKPKQYKIRHYFNRLRGLPYEKVSIQFYYVYISNNLALGPDKKYHGTVNYIQRFQGDFINNELKPYIDTVEKTCAITVEKEIVEKGSIPVVNWVLRLGDIQVSDVVLFRQLQQ